MCDTKSILGTIDPLTGLALTGKPPDPLGLFPKKPVIPGVPTPVSTELTSEAAAKKAREDALKKKGRASTILSGGAGVTDSPTLSRPQALGA
jgi:hypothetical protein